MHLNTSPDSALVTAIITTYKGADTVAIAAQSVLTQTHAQVEVIVVDDNGQGSPAQQQTQAALAALNDSRIRYVPHQHNSNGAVARNTGIDAAKGQYICFLDDDDVYLPERIAESVRYLTDNPALAGVCVGVEVHYSATHISTVAMHQPITAARVLTDEMCIGTGSNLFFSRKVFDQGLRFDTAFRRHQDLEFVLCVLRQYQIGNLDQVLVIKKSNATSNIPDYRNFRAAKQMYFTKFAPEIAGLPAAQRNLFYKTHYRLLLDIAEHEGNRKNILTAYKDCLQHGVFYVGDIASVLLGRKNYQKLKQRIAGSR